MLTDLDITDADDGGIFNHKSEYKVETHNIDGWSGYVQKYDKLDLLARESMPFF